MPVEVCEFTQIDCQENEEENVFDNIKSPIIDLIPIDHQSFKNAFVSLTARNNNIINSNINPSRNILKNILTLEPNNVNLSSEELSFNTNINFLKESLKNK